MLENAFSSQQQMKKISLYSNRDRNSCHDFFMTLYAAPVNARHLILL